VKKGKVSGTVLAVPADTHSGSSVGLLPPGQWSFTNGGYHDPDETQKIITRLWTTAWERIGKAREGKRLIVVHMGDATEGAHHGTTELITPRVDEHERIHVEAMELALKLSGFDRKRGDRLYYVRGTPAHVGPGGSSEERIARQFDGSGVIPMIEPKQPARKDGRFVWNRIRLEVHGKLFDLAHHGAGVGLKPWTRTNPLRGKLQEVYWRTIEAGTRVPDYWVRAHRHVKAHDIFISNTGRRLEGFITPAFQNKTEFSYKVAADMPPSLGLLFFDVSDTGHVEPYWELTEADIDEVITV
jgi:hypothetical protein